MGKGVLTNEESTVYIRGGVFGEHALPCPEDTSHFGAGKSDPFPSALFVGFVFVTSCDHSTCIYIYSVYLCVLCACVQLCAQANLWLQTCIQPCTPQPKTLCMNSKIKLQKGSPKREITDWVYTYFLVTKALV